MPTASRRACLRGGVALAAWLLASAHTPYRQWVVYRRRRLLIGSSKAEPASYELGKRVAAALLAALPESMARVSRAPDKFRLASLLSTDQMEVALLRAEDAAALADGRDPFRDYGGGAGRGRGKQSANNHQSPPHNRCEIQTQPHNHQKVGPNRTPQTHPPPAEA